MRLTCHVLPYEDADGPANMALDEALLDTAAENGQTAYLRTYGWTVPTLSLGYFQHLAEVQNDPRWQSVSVVRRLTGGGAIWHHHEVTYALIVPAGYPGARPGTTLYRAVHAAIAETLIAMAVAANRWGDATPQQRSGHTRPFLCFIDRDTEDLVFHGFKLVGSAQRRRRGAILQHGSLLLAGSPQVPELRGLCDLVDVPRHRKYWSERLSEHLPAALGLQPEAVAVGQNLRARATELETTRYRNAGWTAAR